MEALTADRLAAACSDEGTDAGISIVSTLEPVAGAGAPIRPAIYEGGVYQHDRRWWDLGEGLERLEAIVVDNVPSQANRIEEAMQGMRSRLGLPEILLDLSDLSLPVHLPRVISCFQFPHRNADAYLRDAALEGIEFPRTEVGKRVFAATARSPEALFEWMPQALLFGFWQSHLGKKRQQSKLARSWVSEVIGFEPAASDTKAHGLKGDPLNLSMVEGVAFNEGDVAGWTVADSSGRPSGGSKLSAIGHGQVPVEGSVAGVSFRSIVQQTSLSFAGLRRIEAANAEASKAGRSLLAALGVVGHVAAFGRPFSLRSGCDLGQVAVSWRLRQAQDDVPLAPLDLDGAIELFNSCTAMAEAAGLPVGSRWSEPLRLVPNQSLATAIAKSWPDLED